MNLLRCLGALVVISVFFSCKSKVQERKDELYSRHLQQKVQLKIFNTPVPDNKSDFNLLLLNNAQDFEKLEMKDILKSLNKEKEIQPLLIVAIRGDKKFFGIVGDGKIVEKNRDAEKYDDFILNELIAYIKKQSGVRKFKTIAVAGYGKAGLTALDMGWDHAEKINYSGIFKPEYELKNDTSYIFKKIKPSRKRPKTSYWFYEQKLNNQSEISPTQQIIELIKQKVNPLIDAKSDMSSDSEAFSGFLRWAFHP